MAYLMGIDLGTSSLKTIIIDEAGNVKALSARPYQFASPHGGYAEHDPREWWQACCETVKEALAALGDVTLPTVGIRMATAMVTIGPIVLLYPFLQKYFIKGVVIGAVKE